MTTRRARVAIVGGGLGGLVAARALQRHGVREIVLFEARRRLGGRILSIDAAGAVVDPAVPAIDRFDLGPTWFWPGFQPQMDRLADELGLERFESFEEGAMLVERSDRHAPVRMPGFASDPASVRFRGGTGALIAALCRQVDPGCVRTGERVRRMRRVEGQVELVVENEGGEASLWCAGQVLLALPPRLAERSIAFEPPLPLELARRWRATPTWMAPHAKYVAVYDTPFWRDQGLSGAARSGRGPMGEIHDVSMPGGHAALFGFLGVPAHVRRQVPEDALRAHCRTQLGRLFGERAAAPTADALKDWSDDPLTATDDDREAAGHHAAAPPSGASEGPWSGCLTGIGSEWSQPFPGYLAGAVEAAMAGAQQALLACPGRSKERDG